MIETMAPVYEFGDYDPKFVDILTKKLLHFIKSGKGNFQKQMLQSYFKSYKLLRYPYSDIYEAINNLLIKKV